MDYKISQLKALQIANWDGIVMGGGVGISAFAPFIIAT
jgi:enoyl-CoA hydratase/carnithine racemase